MVRQWPVGLPTALDYPPVTVGALFGAAAARFPDRVAVRDNVRALTFAELYRRACNVAHGLRERGVRDGDIVLVHLPNCPGFVVAYYGILLAGATVSMGDPLAPVALTHEQLRDGGVRVAVSHPANAESLLRAAPGSDLGLVVLVDPSEGVPAFDDGGEEADSLATAVASSAVAVVGLDELGADHRPTPPVTGVGPDDLAHLAYTGGTTGRPKGVRVRHRNVVGNVTQLMAWYAGHALRIDRAGRLEPAAFPAASDAPLAPGRGAYVRAAPLFHAAAFVHVNLQFVLGASVVTQPRFTPIGLLEEIARHRVTYVTGSPPMWRGLLVASEGGLELDFGSVALVSSREAPIDPEMMEGLHDLFPHAIVTEGYGLAEGTCLISSTPALHGAQRPLGSVGPALCDTEIVIRDRADPERLVPDGHDGEIWVRGPQVTDGYLGVDPPAEATQATDGESGLRTGDVGRLDAEGYLTVADRAEDVLLYRGHAVYPRELEELLVEYPGVAAVAVIGRPDPEAGEIPVAVLAPRIEARLDPAEVMAFVARQVVPYKRIREVVVVDRLPTSAAGKVLKYRLRDRLERR